MDPLIVPSATSASRPASREGERRSRSQAGVVPAALVHLRLDGAEQPVPGRSRIGAGGDGLFEIAGKLRRRQRDDLGVREAVSGLEARTQRGGRFRNGVSDRSAAAPDRSRAAADPAPGNTDSRAPLPCCASTPCSQLRVSQSRVSWTTRPPDCDDLDLPFDLVLDRVLEKAERVQVLDLGFRAQRGLASRADGHVRVAPQAALFHVSVVDLKRDTSSSRRYPKNAAASFAVRRSGSVTISMSGVPARFKST